MLMVQWLLGVISFGVICIAVCIGLWTKITMESYAKNKKFLKELEKEMEA